jgi:hypothetical protein
MLGAMKLRSCCWWRTRGGVVPAATRDGGPMEGNRCVRLEALECADMAAKPRDPRAKAVLTTAATLWRSLAT